MQDQANQALGCSFLLVAWSIGFAAGMVLMLLLTQFG